MSITRYDFKMDSMVSCYCEMEEAVDGTYVSYEDYKNLEIRNSELESYKSEIERLAKEIQK